MHKYAIAIMVAISALMLSSCKETGPQKVAGYDYEILSKKGGKVAQPGDYVYFNLAIKDQNDSILQELTEGPRQPKLQIPVEPIAGMKPNPIEKLVQIIGVGDEAKIIMPKDSMGPLPPNMQHVEYFSYTIKPTQVLSEEEFKADQERKRAEQMKAIEEMKAMIPAVETQVKEDLKVFEKGGSAVKTTPSGLKYVIHKEGSGAQAQKGDRVKVHYYGVLTDGTMFDNSYRSGNEFSFTVDRGEVIAGWDEALKLLKEGGSGSFYLPYTLAYGEAGSPPVIPAKSDLVFHIDFKNVVK